MQTLSQAVKKAFKEFVFETIAVESLSMSVPTNYMSRNRRVHFRKYARFAHQTDFTMDLLVYVYSVDGLNIFI